MIPNTFFTDMTKLGPALLYCLCTAITYVKVGSDKKPRKILYTRITTSVFLDGGVFYLKPL